MSRETDMAEEKTMLEFLHAKGITTLDQLKDIFRHQNEKDDDDVEFVKETKTCINDAKLIMLLEASKRNKQILMNKLSITAVTTNTAGTSNTAVTTVAATTSNSQPTILAQQIATVPVAGHIVGNAHDITKNATSLPMRYRHKHTHQYHPYQQEIRRQQQRQLRPQLHQAYEGNAHQQNIQYNQYHHQQHNYYVHNQNRYEGLGQNMTGYNNGCVYTMATWQSGGVGVGINSIGQTIPVSQPLASTTVYNAIPQQQWPTTTFTVHTGHSGYNNYCQFHTAPQASQQPASQYIFQGSRPIYNQN